MGSFASMWMALGLFFAVAWVISTWIRAKHGYPLGDGMGGQVHPGGRPPEHVAKQIEAALAERDATLARLEERVRVLERIATDNPARLSAEIESLRDESQRRSAS
jgi:hypothetical protein